MEKFIVIIILFFLIFVSSCSDSKIEIVTENTLQGELISLEIKNLIKMDYPSQPAVIRSEVVLQNNDLSPYLISDELNNIVSLYSEKDVKLVEFYIHHPLLIKPGEIDTLRLATNLIEAKEDIIPKVYLNGYFKLESVDCKKNLKILSEKHFFEYENLIGNFKCIDDLKIFRNLKTIRTIDGK